MVYKYNNMANNLDLLGELKKVVFRFDVDDIEKIKIIAAKKRTTQNNLFVEAMKDLLKKYERLWK
jgi:hypothetical protein